MQCMLVTTALIDKPNGDGDRPITLLSFLYRTVAKAEGGRVQDWEKQAAGAWDIAVKGQNLLDAV